MDLTFPQAEEAVIGAILIDGDGVLPELVERLRESDFSDATLRHLFAAARELYLAKKPVDPVTIGAAAGAGKEYGEVALAIMRRTPTAANAMEYAAIVREHAQLRAIQMAGWELSQCRDLDEARALLSQAASLSADSRREESQSWRELAAAFIEQLNTPPDAYLDLGIEQLTRAARIRQGHFVVLGAYNSVGKTALALQLAFAIAATGKRVGFFSLETASELLTMRIFAQQTGVRLTALQDRSLGESAARSLCELANASYDYPLEFVPASGFTAADIRAKTMSHRLDVIFVDYVQLIVSEGESPALQVRASSIALHNLAQQLGVAVFALSQVTLPQRDSKGRRPPLRRENLRESAQLGNDADVVLLLDLSDPDDYDSNRVLRMDKNKDVGQARMLLSFDGPHVRFAYLPPLEDAEDQAARERNATMDKNRERRAQKEAEAAQKAEEFDAAFRELTGGAEGLPF